MLEEGNFIISPEQYNFLKINYIDAQVNDMAIMALYNLNDVYTKTKYFAKSAKQKWKELWKRVRKYEKGTVEFVCSGMLADYSCMVEDYVGNDVKSMKEGYFKEIMEQGKPSKEDGELLSHIQLVLSLCEYAKCNWNRMEKHKENYVSESSKKHELAIYSFEHFRFDEVYKAYSKFVDEVYKMIPCGEVNLHDSKLCNANIKAFDDIMMSKRVKNDLLNTALELEERESDIKRREVTAGVPFSIGRGRFIPVKFNDIRLVKCELCAFKGRAACELYNCSGVYFKKYDK